MILLLWGAAFCISCRISSINYLTDQKQSKTSLAAAAAGELRSALSLHFYEMADLYFHKGIPHEKEHAFENNFFQRLAREISPETHIHLHGEDVKEIMPWLTLAIKANPQNVQLYLVAAFWIARELGRYDVAHELLLTAQSENPFSYQIKLDQARLYLKEGRIDKSVSALDAALAFWTGKADATDRSTLQDRSVILNYRALLHEHADEYKQALGCYEIILHDFPEKQHIARRVAMLHKGENPAVSAANVWKTMLHAESEAAAKCPHDDHGHEDK